jgi:hypothetical protein
MKQLKPADLRGRTIKIGGQAAAPVSEGHKQPALSKGTPVVVVFSDGDEIPAIETVGPRGEMTLEVERQDDHDRLVQAIAKLTKS